MRGGHFLLGGILFVWLACLLFAADILPLGWFYYTRRPYNSSHTVSYTYWYYPSEAIGGQLPYAVAVVGWSTVLAHPLGLLRTNRLGGLGLQRTAWVASLLTVVAFACFMVFFYQDVCTAEYKYAMGDWDCGWEFGGYLACVALLAGTFISLKSHGWSQMRQDPEAQHDPSPGTNGGGGLEALGAVTI
jgi:hypothetical protein